VNLTIANAAEVRLFEASIVLPNARQKVKRTLHQSLAGKPIPMEDQRHKKIYGR
jgi:hypothetical protein